jgi:hypothetical protein
MNADANRVEELLNEYYEDRVFVVETDMVWVSGMNAHCASLARRMERVLVENDIPCGLVHDDGAVKFGGVQFNWGEAA